ncbi:addiction module antitoxin [Candidatus Desantisbacteria bacterium CG_4_8_14_3_um_filter_40_12]|uniref:Addiction module antitoxin n=1 Tax=Candidatus Desantisbacteria bacterium CG_4_8_14_3_um_filter_40_12 TaxID=1974545 RepID=A0A2M7JEU6_9BACT|nr:MAG: addiction module antitoxin [Candidatus Desantisbacteria bacterium CG_4_8_14_3_um_filter_40_12]
MQFRICFSKPFKRSLQQLRKRYPQIQSDIESAIEVLFLHPSLGILIPHTIGVRKLRVPSSNMARGKRGGFRLLYLLDIEKNCIILLFVYAKPIRENLSQKEIESLVKEVLEEE